jgi:hypothetical protein
MHGSVRRLLAIGNFENITVELPINGPTELDYWITVRLVHERLLEWILYINSGRTVAQGKSVFDQVTAEMSYINGRIGQLQQSQTDTK